MQFQYLGTAAAEGWPAVFCRCKYCLEAQRLGGNAKGVVIPLFG